MVGSTEPRVSRGFSAARDVSGGEMGEVRGEIGGCSLFFGCLSPVFRSYRFLTQSFSSREDGRT